MESGRHLAGPVMILLLFTACARTPPPPPPAPLPPPADLPDLVPPGQISPVSTPPAPTAGINDPLANLAPGENVSINATAVEIRTLLTALAEASDLSLVIGPEVTGQITVNLVDVPALEAFRLVLAEADLMVAAPAFSSPWGPVVFYVLPVNIWEADAELIRARYRVSKEMADWIVETRLETDARVP